MPHRGRVSLLTEFFNLNLEKLYLKILGNSEANYGYGYSGDVLSHLYKRSHYIFEKNKTIDLILLPNPSHLESINPVACGLIKAHQIALAEDALLIQIHGDAAVAGQGVVYETANMSRLPGYDIGGSIHIVVNNQLGFTAEARHSRSSAHPTDVANVNGCPVIHVNGDYPDLAASAGQIALSYRERFRKDIYINLVCYRKYGHNEVDDPTLTNPHIYHAIRKKQSVPDMYTEQLIKKISDELNEEKKQMSTEDRKQLEKYGSPEYWLQFKTDLENKYNEALDVARGIIKESTVSKHVDFNLLRESPNENNGANYKDNFSPPQPKYLPFDQCIWPTGLPLSLLQYVGLKSVDLDKFTDFKVHPHLEKTHIKPRIAALQSNKEHKIDWATAETLAIGSLMLQGINVRLSGQDSGRGTFSHRHFELTNQHISEVDQPDLNQSFPERIVPFNHMEYPKQNDNDKNKMDKCERKSSMGTLQIINSPLHELGALSFETGYAWYNAYNVGPLTEPPLKSTLTIWEAQFGDFFNGAQTVIDTFLTSAYQKWGLNPGGLVLLLPHGMDGMGPEHSSCRVERFLQLSNDPEDGNLANEQQQQFINLTIANPSTSAQYYHLLRSQALTLHSGMLTPPLVVMAPKILLRYEDAKSKLAQFAPGTHFDSVLEDSQLVELESKLYFKDSITTPKSRPGVKRLVFCSGKHYYMLSKRRAQLIEEQKLINHDCINPLSVVIVRLELLSPFPAAKIAQILAKYACQRAQTPEKIEIVWAQEEHKNQGAWNYVRPRLSNLIVNCNESVKTRYKFDIRYIGRNEAACPATGLKWQHNQQENKILKEVFE